MSMTVDGTWKAGVWATTVWKSGVWREGTPTPTPSVIPAPPSETIGSKGKKKKRIRGPYSDQAVYEAYIARCIAEREAPRANVNVAVIKEALVQEVQQRLSTEHIERDGLLKENDLLRRLIATETARRDVLAMVARQRQIEALIEQMEDDEAMAIITLLGEM